MASAVELNNWNQQVGADNLSDGSNRYVSPYYYTYTFGDVLSGNMASAKANANQNIADYYAWLRSENSAERQRSWEQYMSSTQYQRAARDLEAAGLNPWLAAQSAGFGGSTPSGAYASSAAGNVGKSAGSPGSSFGSTATGLAHLIKIIAKVVK